MLFNIFCNFINVSARLATPYIFRAIPDAIDWINRNVVNTNNRRLILGQRPNNQIINRDPGNLNPQNAVNGNGKNSTNSSVFAVSEDGGGAKSSLEPDLDTLINSIIEFDFDVLEVFLASFLYLRILVFIVITLRFFIMFYTIICTYFKVYTRK